MVFRTNPGSLPTGLGGAQPGGAKLPAPLLAPDYAGPYLGAVIPALQAEPGSRPSWVPEPLRGARQVVLLVLDGLGWLQLQQRRMAAPVLTSLEGGPISSVAPTTTATALSSLALGMAPNRHGIVGYKFAVDGPAGREVLNVLQWSTPSGDARSFLPPAQLQPQPAFGGAHVPVVSRADFAGSGFSAAHQRGARDVGWVVPSSMPVLVRRLLEEGEPLVYAYYDGVDKVAHASGLGELYDSELSYVDTCVDYLLDQLPPGCSLAVTADHGQVEVGHQAEVLAPGVAQLCAMTSGDARFRWLHAQPGKQTDLLSTSRLEYGAVAWVAARDEVVDAGLFGGRLAPEALARLGDVALVPLDDRAFLDSQDGGDAHLVCRHGGLSAEELLVPLLGALA